VALVGGCSQSSITVIRWHAMPCSVVWEPLMAPLAHSWSHCVWRLTWDHHPPPPTHPLAPLYVVLMIFCAMSEKDSEKQANPNSRYLYDYLLVAMPCCASCANLTWLLSGTGEIIMCHWLFQISISQIYKCAHMVDFCWPGHIYCKLQKLHGRKVSQFIGFSHNVGKTFAVLL